MVKLPVLEGVVGVGKEPCGGLHGTGEDGEGDGADRPLFEGGPLFDDPGCPMGEKWQKDPGLGLVFLGRWIKICA